jgi:chromosome segregation ATPase
VTDILLIIMLAAFMVVYWDSRRKPATLVQHAAQQSVEDLAAKIVVELGEKLDALKEFDQLATKRAQLEVELAALKQEKADIEQGFAVKQRDLQHEAGLLKKQLDAELVQGRAQAGLDADRKILEAERRFNKEALEQERQDFGERIKFIQEYTDKLMALVPRLEARLRLKGDV